MPSELAVTEAIMIGAMLMAMGLLLGLSVIDIGDDGGAAEGSDDPEALKGGDGDDDLYGAGGPDLLVGYEGDDTLGGGSGNDWIFGLDGNDNISGGTENDVISGGSGADTITGGAGNDFVESAGILDEQALLASVKTAKDFGDITFDYDYSTPEETGDTIELGDGDDTIVAGAADIITTGNGQDQIAAGDWSSGQPPLVITDFDARQDVITYAYDRDAGEPVFQTVLNQANGTAEIYADGELFAIIQNVDPSFEPVEIATRNYAA